MYQILWTMCCVPNITDRVYCTACYILGSMYCVLIRQCIWTTIYHRDCLGDWHNRSLVKDNPPALMSSRLSHLLEFSLYDVTCVSALVHGFSGIPYEVVKIQHGTQSPWLPARWQRLVPHVMYSLHQYIIFVLGLGGISSLSWKDLIAADTGAYTTVCP